MTVPVAARDELGGVLDELQQARTQIETHGTWHQRRLDASRLEYLVKGRSRRHGIDGLWSAKRCHRHQGASKRVAVLYFVRPGQDQVIASQSELRHAE